jgi:hypothetical protein
MIGEKVLKFYEAYTGIKYKISGKKLKKSIDLEEKVKQHKNCDTETFNLLNLLEY